MKGATRNKIKKEGKETCMTSVDIIAGTHDRNENYGLRISLFIKNIWED